MKASSAVLAVGALALLPACTPGPRQTLVGRWQAGDEQIEFGEDSTFAVVTPRGSNSGSYRLEGEQLHLDPGGMPELERARSFRFSRKEWSLRLCEMNEPARCTEYQRVETANR